MTVGTEAQATPVRQRRGKKSGRHKTNRWVVRIVAGWFVLLGLIYWAGKVLWEGDQKLGAQTRSAEGSLASRGVSEDAALLQRSMDSCVRALMGFVQARTPEERSQFIHKPLDHVGKVARFYEMNPAPVMQPEALSLASRCVLRVGGEKAIATLWKVADGSSIEAVFFQDGDEWRLDWEHFVRYSDEPWPMFLSGDDTGSGEFRVLARERLARDRRGTGEIGIVAYAPYFGQPGLVGASPPEFLMSRDSEAGRMLVEAFRDLAEQRRPFGDTNPSADPEEMIRLRIKVRREPTAEGGKRFILEQVSAVHWLDSDEPGVK